MKKMATTIAVAVAMLAARAEDIKLLNGQVVHGDVTRVEPDGIVVETSEGIQKLQFDFLPDELQKRYHYAPAKAAEFRSEEVAARNLAARKTMIAAQVESSAVHIRAHILRAVDGGVVATAETQMNETVEKPVVRGTALGRYIGHEEVMTQTWKRLPHPIVLFGLTRPTDDMWEGTVWGTGVITVRDITYSQFAVTKDEAVSRIIADTNPVPVAPPPPPVTETSAALVPEAGTVPSDVLAQIKADAEKLFPTDFKMQLFQIEDQKKAWLKLHEQ